MAVGGGSEKWSGEPWHIDDVDLTVPTKLPKEEHNILESPRWISGTQAFDTYSGLLLQASVKNLSALINSWSGNSRFHSSETLKAPTEIPINMPAVKLAASAWPSSGEMDGWSALGSQEDRRTPARRSPAFSLSTEKGPPVFCKPETKTRHTVPLSLTANPLTKLDEVSHRHLVAPDTPDQWPRALILDSSDDDADKVLHRSEADENIVTALHHENPSPAKVNGGLYRVDVFGRLVRVCQVIHKQAGLKECVLQDL